MPPPPRILVCDHRGKGLHSLLATQGWDLGGLRRSYNLRQSLEALRGEAPDLVVLQPLGRSGGAEIEALDRVRGSLKRRENDPSIPLLIVLNEPAPDMPDGRRLAGGPWDLVRAEAPPAEWRLRMERLLGALEQEEEVRVLRHRASHDDRTDLLRPQAFQERLVEHYSAAHRHGFDLALILIDLDDFGLVNKQHDHTVGDRIITSVGEVIHRTLRAEDVAGRLGGDEFAVLLPYTRRRDAAKVVSRLRDEIHALTGDFPGAKGPIRVSGSLGFETFDGTDLDSLATLRSHAERALRASKESGGNRAVYFRSLENGESPPG